MDNRGWREATIVDICDDIYDGPHATPKKIDKGPIFLSISSLVNGRIVLSESAHLSEEDFFKWTRRVTPQPDDLVFSYETRLGEAALIPEGLRCCLGRRMALIRPHRDKLDPQYFLYYFLSPILQNEIQKYMISGTTVERLALSDIRKFRVILPPVSEQKIIARILKSLDDKIELNRQMNATLEGMAKALFKSWFVDFDPVIDNALVAGNQIPEELADRAEGRRAAIADGTANREAAKPFPAGFQHSEQLGWIPEGWVIKAIEDVADVRSGKRIPKGHTLIDEITPYPYLRGVDFKNGRFGRADVKYLDEETHTKIAKYIVNTNDVVLTIVGTIGRVIYIDSEWDGANLTENAARLTNCEGIGSRRLFQHLSGVEGQEDIQSRIAGSVQGKLPLYQIKAMELVVSDQRVSDEFEVIAAALDESLVRNRHESLTLRAIRDTLLPKLISGELRIPDAEKLAEEGLG